MRSRTALLALAAALAGFSPFQAEEENVRAGNERLRAGAPAEARRWYDDAERKVGRRPEIDFDRGDAAAREGHPAEAKEAFRRAAERAPPALASRALQNLGNVLAAEGDRDGAARAFADALSRDPSNEDARWNLEVLLRQTSQGKGAPRDPGTADRRDAPPEREEGAPRPGAPPRPGAEEERREGRRDPGKRDGREREAGAEDGRRGQEGSAGPRREPIGRQDAEALLDALRARERNMPLFGRERTKARRADAAKDW